ncbi:hydroxymyristoyl-ACP dehydratase [Histophilus somni]|uniref:ApeI family dehydratase n=2 Tax=Histophilus somni TaxID=731 RepID=UPI00201F8E67|nr:hydroxymyristoyl-ACP dehydratase [Histophilus somni]
MLLLRFKKSAKTHSQVVEVDKTAFGVKTLRGDSLVSIEQRRMQSEPVQNPIWLSETQEENVQIFRAKVPPDLCYFKGHFANFPLVPGVVELQWVKEKIDAYFGKEMQMNRIDNLKFQKFLRPNDEFELTLKWEENKNRIGFQLKTEGEMCASGFVIFKNG